MTHLPPQRERRVYCHRNVIILEPDGAFRAKMRLLAVEPVILGSHDLRLLIAAAATEYDRITMGADQEELPRRRLPDDGYVESLRGLSASLALRAGEANRRGIANLAHDLATGAKAAASWADALEQEARDVA